MDASLRLLFEPFRIRRVTFRNRFVSTSHAPGYAVGGNIPQRYVDYESEKAKGGVGLIQFGGATAVSVENSFHYCADRGWTSKVVGWVDCDAQSRAITVTSRLDPPARPPDCVQVRAGKAPFGKNRRYT